MIYVCMYIHMSIYNILKSADLLNLNDCANQSFLWEKRLFNEILNIMTSMLDGIVLCFNVMRLRYLLLTLTRIKTGNITKR